MRRTNQVHMYVIGMLTAVMVLPSAAGYFWTDNPLAWGHDDEPPGNMTDGNLGAVLQHLQGTPSITLTTTLFGSTDPDYPSIIAKTVEEAGLICMWVTTYNLYVERYMGQSTTKCEVLLELYHKNHGQGDWQLADTDSDSVIVNFNDQDPKMAQGWLYVWCDSDYDDTDQFMLKATAKCQYFNGFWIDIGESPQTNQVYFEIDVV